MKYTKEQLLGAIFRWVDDYKVIWNNDGSDLMIINIRNKIIHNSHNLETLNDCIKADPKCLYKLREDINFEIY